MKLTSLRLFVLDVASSQFQQCYDVAIQTVCLFLFTKCTEETDRSIHGWKRQEEECCAVSMLMPG